MAIIQTRYTYPMAQSKNVRLFLNFLQKYHYYQGGGTVLGGININKEAGQVIDIYRFDGRSKSRFDMSSYDHITEAWQGNPPDFERQMAILGYTKVFSDNSTAHPNQFQIEEFGRNISYDLNTNDPIFATPALYQDVWWIKDTFGHVVGPISQHFRLESRIYSPIYEKLSYWCDLTPYPSDLPWQNGGYPISVGVSPVIKHTMNNPPYAALRSLLSTAYVVIVDGYRVEDDYGNPVQPHEYHVFNKTLSEQIFNFFFDSWNTIGLPPGTYKVRYRIVFMGADKNGGTLDNATSYQEDYWKTIRITKLRQSKLPAPIEIPYDSIGSISPAQPLYPFVLGFDKNAHRFTNNVVTTVSHYHEPRVADPVYVPSTSPNEILSMHEFESSEFNALIDLPHYPSPNFLPMVFINGTFARPSEPLDGSGIRYDYYIVGKTVRKSVGAWNSIKVVYGYRGFEYPGGFSHEGFSVSDAVMYSGNHYFLLDKVPNGAIARATTQDTHLFRGTDYTIHINNAVANHFGKSAIGFSPGKFSSLKYWVSIYYSYGPKTSGATPPNIQSIVDTSGETFTMLPRNMLNTYPMEIYHGSSLLVSGQYTLTHGGPASQSRVDYNFTPSQPITMWFN